MPSCLSCPTLCDPTDWSRLGPSPRGSPAGMLGWAAKPSSRGSPEPATEPGSCRSHTAGGFSTTEPPGSPQLYVKYTQNPKATVGQCDNQVPIHQGQSRRLSGKESACKSGDTGDVGLIPGLGKFPGRGRGNPLQYSCQENPMNRGAWWATVPGTAQTQLK